MNCKVMTTELTIEERKEGFEIFISRDFQNGHEIVKTQFWDSTYDLTFKEEFRCPNGETAKRLVQDYSLDSAHAFIQRVYNP